MFFIDVTGPAGTRTVVLPTADLTIGSGPDSDIQLAHPSVAAHHVTVTERAKRAVVLDEGTSKEGTLVNGVPIDAATVLTDSCQIGIGPFLIRFRYVELPPDTAEAITEKIPVPPSQRLTPIDIILDQPPASSAPTPQMPFPVALEEVPISSLLRASDDPEELEFLRAIAIEGSATEARVAYAEWLESRGDLTRADYLRALSRPSDPTLAILGAHIAAPWRAAVAPPSLPIENCGVTGCPKTWGRTLGADRGSIDDMRRCRVCVRYVRYVTGIHHARLLAAGDRPVVIDPCVPRTPGDLEELPERMRCVI
jgi:uncharacterized protein (TIGR02996 family)